MSGETEAEVSAWTVDSLRFHFEQRFTAQEAAVTAAIQAVRELHTAVLAERDDRYGQRFDAQEKALVLALANVDREFHERIRQVQEETRVAMAAAEKAITKAEIATEKRFDAVNEFRAQQADVIATFARKSEIDQRIAGLAEKLDSIMEQGVRAASTCLPRAEYDRAHIDLAERVINLEKAFGEKLEVQAKGFEARIALLQTQLGAIEAVTR